MKIGKSKKHAPAGGPIAGYGKELLLQIPVGRGQTRTLSLRQAKCAYKALYQLRHLFR
jgi:hypothetical protein